MNTFHIYRDRGGFYRWRLVARNGEKVAASEAYVMKAAAIESAEKVKVWSANASIIDDEPIRTLIKLMLKKK